MIKIDSYSDGDFSIKLAVLKGKNFVPFGVYDLFECTGEKCRILLPFRRVGDSTAIPKKSTKKKGS